MSTFTKIFIILALISVPLALLFDKKVDSMIFVEGSFMYVSFGRGKIFKKMFYGMSAGFVYKVGRI